MVIAMALPLALHLLAAVVWVGGMFYAYLAMRPAVVQVIDPAQRPALWAATLERFFRWVWAAVVLLLATGFGMVFGVYKGMANVEWHIHAMIGLGILMMLLFAHVYFAPFRRLKQAVAEGWLAVVSVEYLVYSSLTLALIRLPNTLSSALNGFMIPSHFDLAAFHATVFLLIVSAPAG